MCIYVCMCASIQEARVAEELGAMKDDYDDNDQHMDDGDDGAYDGKCGWWI